MFKKPSINYFENSQTHPNFSIALYSRSAKVIGGDYASIIDCFDGVHIGILLLDIVGKGVSAGFKVQEWKRLFDDHAKDELDPAELLFKLNNLAVNAEEITHPAPLFYGVFNKKTSELTYCNAGHESPLFFNNESFKYLDEGGFPLGAEANERYERGIVKISKNNVVTFFTDGITEANHNRGDDYGEARLKELIKHDSKLPSTELLNKIIQNVSEFTNFENQYDDLTCIVLTGNTEFNAPAPVWRQELDLLSNFDVVFNQSILSTEISEDEIAIYKYDLRIIQAFLMRNQFVEYKPEMTIKSTQGYLNGYIKLTHAIPKSLVKKLVGLLGSKFNGIEVSVRECVVIRFRRHLSSSFIPVSKTAGVLVIDSTQTIETILTEGFEAIFTFHYHSDMLSAISYMERKPDAIKLILINEMNFSSASIKSIKALNSLVEVIVFTDHYSNTEWIKSLNLGVFELIKLPVTGKVLKQTLTNALLKVDSSHKHTVDNYQSFDDILSQSTLFIRDVSPELKNLSLFELYSKFNSGLLEKIFKSLDQEFEDHFEQNGFSAMVIEDEVDVNRFVCEILLEEGVDPISYHNSEDALNCKHLQGIDIVFCDIGLPGVSGIELVKQLKLKRPELEVVMLTGFKEEEKVVGSFKNDILDYLIKPVDIKRLKKVIQSSLLESFYKRRLGGFGYKYLVQNQQDTIARSLVLKAYVLNASNQTTITLETVNALFPRFILSDRVKAIAVPKQKIRSNIFEVVEDFFYVSEHSAATRYI